MIRLFWLVLIMTPLTQLLAWMITDQGWPLYCRLLSFTPTQVSCFSANSSPPWVKLNYKRNAFCLKLEWRIIVTLESPYVRLFPLRNPGKVCLWNLKFSLWNPESKGTVIIIAWGWGGGDLADPPFECYFTEVIPPNNIWWLSRSPPPHPMSSFSKQIWVIPPLNPSKVFSGPLFGFSVTNDPPFCSHKNQVIPPKVKRPPLPSQGDK